jgi:hypothetical protein
MTTRTATITLGANGTLLIGLLIFNLVVAPPEGRGEGAPMARIGAVVGQVEIKKKGSKRWVPAEVTEVLQEGDEIRTGLFSDTTLHLRGSSSVIVSANTSFVVGQDVVGEDQTERSLFELGVGQITAAIPRGTEHEYQFHSKGSDAVASAQQGEFSLTTDGRGTVVVDTRAGDVKLKAKGKEVVVKKGRRSVVKPNKAPSRVMPIPSSVALQVKWPPTKIDRTRTSISGHTTPGTLVMVNGFQVRADHDGKWSLDVPLREGSNRLVVSVTDSAGNSTRRESPEIRVDTVPPGLEVDAKDLWK